MAVNPTQPFLTPPPAATMSSLTSSTSNATESKTTKVAPPMIHTTARRNSAVKPNGTLRFDPPRAPELPQKPVRAGIAKPLNPQLLEIANRALVTGGFAKNLERQANDEESAGEGREVSREEMEAFADASLPSEHDGNESPPCTDEVRRLLGGLSYPIPDGLLEREKYVCGGKIVTVPEINYAYGRSVPESLEELDPNQLETPSSFLLSELQKKSLRESEQEGKIVKLGDVEITESDLAYLTSLFKGDTREVILHNCPNLREVGFLTKYENLQQLVLSCCENLSANCFGLMHKNMWQNLIVLKLPGNPKITDATIMNLPVLHSLLEVDLSYCKGITVKAIVDLFKHPKLEKIYYEGIALNRWDIAKIQRMKPDRIELVGNPMESNKDFEKAQNWPYLRNFIREYTRGHKDNWDQLSELLDLGKIRDEKKQLDRNIEKDIEDFYNRQLTLRKLHVKSSLATPEGWADAEEALQKCEGRNIQIIMDTLMPELARKLMEENGKKDGLFVQKPHLKNVQFGGDCFECLWMLMQHAEFAKLITELDLSNKGLDEIPLSFLGLCLTRLKKLNLSGNKKITKLPGPHVDWHGKRQHHMHNLTTLEILNLSGCSISSLGDDLALGNLFHLKAAVDEDDPDLFTYVLQELKYLDLNGNQLETLPELLGISLEHGEQYTQGRYETATEIFREKPTKVQIETLVNGRQLFNRVIFDFRNNKITKVPQELIDYLITRDPVHFILRTGGNGLKSLPTIPKKSNVILDNSAPEHNELANAFLPPEEGKRES